MSSTNATGPAEDPDATEGPTILGVILSTWTVALLVLGLRFVARRISRVGLWLDDWLILAGFIMYTLFIGMFVASVVMGAGRHIQFVGAQQFSKVEIMFFVGEILFPPTISLVKLAVLAFYWRIFSASTQIKKPIWALTALVIAWCIAAVIGLVLQCIPPAKLAHPNLPGHCSDKYAVFLGGSIPEVVTDFVILCIPIPFIWKLHTSKRQKWLLTGVFLLGGFACISSIIRLWAFMTRDYASPDLSWTTADSIIWTAVEISAAIISACLLSLRPIVTYIRTGSATPTTEAEKSFAFSRSKASGGTGSSGSKSGTWKRSFGRHTDTSVSQSESITRYESTAKNDTIARNESIQIPMALRDEDGGGITALPSLGPDLGHSGHILQFEDDAFDVRYHELRA